MPPPQSHFDAANKALHVAVKMDNDKQYSQAADNYIIGIEYLMKHLATLPPRSIEADKLDMRIKGYMARAETLKSEVKKTIIVKTAHQQIIQEDDVGHSYESIFKGLLNEKVTIVRIEEPYLDSTHQMLNLVRFCEMLVNQAPNLKQIFLTTKVTYLKLGMEVLAGSLAKKNIKLVTEIQEIHDREIRFDNGTLVKMGRGLDIYKKVDKFSIGSSDYNMRPCKSCKIEIMKTY